MTKQKWVPALFQLLFDFKVLDKVPKVHYLPWMSNQDNLKTSVVSIPYDHFINEINKCT